MRYVAKELNDLVYWGLESELDYEKRMEMVLLEATTSEMSQLYQVKTIIAQELEASFIHHRRRYRI